MVSPSTFAITGVSEMAEPMLPNDLLPARIAVVCHDAGGANLIMAMLARLDRQRHQVSAYMEGPAEKLWQKRFPQQAMAPSIEAALAQADVLLSGTGWASDLEFDARLLARQRGLHTIAMLDHWVNYQERFVRHGQTVLPDQIWVCDEDAHGIAQGCFPGLTVICVPNDYLQEQVAALPPADSIADELLYVLEPARTDWGQGVPGEFQALDYFAERWSLIEASDDIPIRLRPHPSDPVGKYDDWIGRHAHLNVSLDNSFDLHTALARASRVAGCESFGMVVALAAGRRVYCTLPPVAPPCRLPHQGLIHLKDLRK